MEIMSSCTRVLWMSSSVIDVAALISAGLCQKDGKRRCAKGGQYLLVVD